MAALTNNVIVVTGWRGAYRVCGAFGVVIAVVGLFTMRDPPREIVEKEHEEEEIEYKESKLNSGKSKIEVTLSKS